MRMRTAVAVAVWMLFTMGTAAAQECDTFQRECVAGMCQDGACVGVPLNTVRATTSMTVRRTTRA